MSARVVYDGSFRLDWLAPGEQVTSAGDGSGACVILAHEGVARRIDIGDEITLPTRRARQATYPADPALAPMSIDEVAEIVKGRIKTAFAPLGDIDNAEVAQKAEWVVNGIDMWGVSPS